MSAYSYHLERILPPLSSAMAILSLAGGIYGTVDPQAFGTGTGIPITSVDRTAIPFASFVAARNLAGGVTLLSLLQLGHKKAAGLFLLCGTITAELDAWIVYKNKGSKAAGHAIMGVIAGLLGAGLYWGVD